MRDRKRRIKKLESELKREKAHWLLMDGTQAEAYDDEILDCFVAVMRRRPHPLLEQVLNADTATYSGSGTFLQLIQKLCQSRERRLNA